MESPRPLSLSPSNSLRRRSVDGASASSPEFEFWNMFGRDNQSNLPSAASLLSADELFSGGVILPLHFLPASIVTTPSAATHQGYLQLVSESGPDPVLGPGPPDEEPLVSSDSKKTQSRPVAPEPDPEPGPAADPDSEPSPSILSAPTETVSFSSGLTASKRWRDIFKKSDRSSATNTAIEEKSDKKEKQIMKKKEKKREKKNGGNSSAELNINLWPFPRSWSAGNNGAGSGGRPRLAAAAASGRKVSSAPCSRSNSAGESKSRKWPSSPGRGAMGGGVHVGRSSPVWQVRRNGSGRAEKGVLVNKDVPETGGQNKSSIKGRGGGGGGGKTSRVLNNLNVPMCIGHRQHLTCRSDESFTIGGSAGTNDGEGGGGGSRSSVGGSGGNLFNLRSLWSSKKVLY